MKKFVYIIPVLVVLIALVFLFNRRNKNKLDIHPKMGPIVESIYGLGTVQSDNVYNLKLGVTTMVKKLLVKEGERVQKGQRLLLFDDEGSQVQYAPFDATVTQINYFAGETVFPQASILTLMDLDKRYVSVALDQEGALRVRPKQKALLSFESLKDQSFAGTVRAIFPRQGLLIAHIQCGELPAEVLPGMTADVAILVGEKPKATLVPLKAVQQSQIRLKRTGAFELTPVKLGIVDSEWAEILSPELKESDLIEMPGE